jgi:toxin-antitoxin system PIN domain toxin
MTHLLDVNVLVALFDPAHPNHESAHAWFGEVGRQAWASCPLTENGLVRVLSHPRYPSVNATAAEVAERLAELCSHSGHLRWPCDVSLLDGDSFSLRHVSGPGQLTDVYLLGLAVCHGGRLATFDRRIPAAAVPQGGRDALALIPS